MLNRPETHLSPYLERLIDGTELANNVQIRKRLWTKLPIEVGQRVKGIDYRNNGWWYTTKVVEIWPLSWAVPSTNCHWYLVRTENSYYAVLRQWK